MSNEVNFKDWASNVILVGTFIIGIFSGILSWKMLEPDGIGGWILFSVVWWVISFILRFVFVFLIGIFGGIKDNNGN